MIETIKETTYRLQKGLISKEEADNILLNILRINGGILPVGFKIYKCTDCQEINIKKDNHQITVGFCDKCGHPLWN